MVFIELAIIAVARQVRKSPVYQRWHKWKSMSPKGLEYNLQYIGLEVYA